MFALAKFLACLLSSSCVDTVLSVQPNTGRSYENATNDPAGFLEMPFTAPPYIPALFLLATILTFLLSSRFVVPNNSTGPVVTLNYGSFRGNATGDLVEFLGIPFAAPPYAFLLYFLLAAMLTNSSLKALGIFDLHRRNRLSNLLESGRLLVLEQLALSKQ